MIRKHDIQLIATHLRRSQPLNPSTKLGYHIAMTAVANALQESNPNFDRARFVEACTTGPVAVPVVQNELELQS